MRQHTLFTQVENDSIFLVNEVMIFCVSHKYLKYQCKKHLLWIYTCVISYMYSSGRLQGRETHIYTSLLLTSKVFIEMECLGEYFKNGIDVHLSNNYSVTTDVYVPKPNISEICHNSHSHTPSIQTAFVKVLRCSIQII